MRGGLDLGGTKIQAVVTARGARVVGQARGATRPARRPRGGRRASWPRAIARRCRRRGGRASASSSRSAIGAPGSIDAAAGHRDAGREHRGSGGAVPARPCARRRARACRSSLGNDVNVAVEAERRFGAGRGVRSFLGVFWGTGVGGGLVVDGRLLVGRGSAGEIGHVCAKPGGRRCNCGLRGCVEAYAGRGALEARARREAREAEDGALRAHARSAAATSSRAASGCARSTPATRWRADLLERGGRGAGCRDRRRPSRCSTSRRSSSAAGSASGSGPAWLRADREGRRRAHVLPRSAGLPARRARRHGRRDRREPARRPASERESRRHRGGRAGSARRSPSGCAPTATRSSRPIVVERRRTVPARRPRGRATGPRAVDALDAAGEPWGLVNCAARTVVRDLFEIEHGRVGRRPRHEPARPFLGIRAVGPLLRARRAGRIVNVASDSAFRGIGVTGAHYAASKAALITLTRRAAAALAAAGVTVERGRSRHARRRDRARARRRPARRARRRRAAGAPRRARRGRGRRRVAALRRGVLRHRRDDPRRRRRQPRPRLRLVRDQPAAELAQPGGLEADHDAEDRGDDRQQPDGVEAVEEPDGDGDRAAATPRSHATRPIARRRPTTEPSM